MRVKYAGLTAVALATGLLAPTAHANHQFGDVFIDGGGTRNGGSVPTERVVPLERAGFDWGDAAVGAAFSLGAALLLLGIALVAWRTRARVGGVTA